MHPGARRCSSVEYFRYSSSSRLDRRAPRPSRCDAALPPRTPRAQTMPVNVVMPQMGESVTEGTVVRWIRKVGDPVDRDEPLFEISTDKVNAEIPSPAAGTLAAIHVKEGETVPVDALVAVIAQAGEAVEAGPQADGVPGKSATVAPQVKAVGVSTPPPVKPAERAEAGEIQSREAGRLRSSPLVRRIASEHHVDIG